MKKTFGQALLSLLLAAAMVLSMAAPAAGLIGTVSAAETDLVDYDSMSMQEILALDEELTWVFAGDSITHNASFTNGMNSYPEWFEQYLYTAGRQDKVINTAWGGAVVEDFLYYEDTPNKYGLKDNDGETGKGIENMITNYNPDVVFIKLGMNNRGTATDKFIGYYELMLDSIYAEGEKNGKIPKIIVITPTPLGGDSLQGKEYFADKENQATADNVWRFQMILEKLVPEYNEANGRNMEFVDFMTGFTSEVLAVGDAYAGTFFTDGSDGGLHPNQAAQYLMFNILCEELGLYDESNPVFGFTYDDINNRAHYSNDTYISDYTGQYHNANDVVAMIGDVSYDTFFGAFEAAVEAGTATIKLCKDVDLTASLAIPAGVSITITDDGSAHTFTRSLNFTGTLFDVTGSLTLSGALTVDGASISTAVPAVTMNGGAVVNVDGVTFQNNVSTKTAGVINLGQGTLTVANAVFTGNTGTSGGAIYAGNNAVVEITDSTFTSNKATGNGGAFYCENKSSAKLTGCTFEGNDAPSGSAIQIAADNGDYRLTLKNCDFIGNKTTYAIHAWRDAYITLDGCQFSGNSAGDVCFNNRTLNGDTTPDEYQFVYILATERAATGTIYLENNAYPVRIGGTLAEGSNVKLSWAAVPTGTAVQFDDEASAQANTGYIYLADALSVDYVLSYEGAAATVTEKPQVTYVAKLGDVSYETYDALAAAIGALESGTEATVTILADVVATGAITVPAGVTLTITDDGTARTIYRDASLTGSMFSVNGTLNFASTSTNADVVNGAATGAASKLTINGNGVAQTGAMVGVGSGAKVTVNQGVRFTNTTANSAAGVFALGGNAGVTLTIAGGVFDNHNNAALWAGTISAWAGNTLTIKNAVFDSNSGTNIGVLYLFTPKSAYEIENCVFTNNSSKYGGAISLSAALTANITNCTFINNTATNRGGAITLDNKSAVCNLSGCTFTNNTVNGADHAVKAHTAGSTVTVDGTSYTGTVILTNAQVTSTAAAAMLAEVAEETTAPASWTSLVDENNTWVITGPEQVFGYQSLNAHRSIFRLMDGSVRCWWPYKDNRFVQAQGEDVEALLASFDADTGIMAAGQDIDIYMLMPQVNAAFAADYVHSAELVAAYKTAVQAIADKAKATGMTLVLWTPLAAADDTVNGYLADYAEAIRQIDASTMDHILLFDAYAFMNERMSANAALENNWFAEDADISPLLANDLVRCFWSKAEMCDNNLLNQVRDHNLRIGSDKQTHKGNYIADGIAYGVSVSGESVTVDASAILTAYPEMTDLRVAILPVAGCGNYNDAIWQDYAAIENGTVTFDAPWDNAAITVYGDLNGYTYRFKDVTLSVSVANDKTLPVYETEDLTDLRVVGAPAFGFDAATDTYTVELYQYQKNVQILAQGGDNLTVTVNGGEAVEMGEYSRQIAVPGKIAAVTVTVSNGKTYTLNLVKPDYPDIIITEVLEDPSYSTGLYEMIEIYNASGKDLNIKDYSIGYKIESTYALIANDGSGNAVDGGLTPYLFTGDNHVFHAVSGTGATYTSINDLTVNSAGWTDAVEPETVNFPADSTMVIWVKQNWQDTKDTESYEDLINAVKTAAGSTTLVVEIDGVETPVAPTADQLIMAEDVDGTDGGQDTFSNHTSENSSENFYLENSGVAKRFWLFVTEAGAVRDDNGSITEAGDDIISAARWNRATAVGGLSTALTYNTDRGFALPYGEGTDAAADTLTTFGAIEYWQKPCDLDDEIAPAASVVYNETGITVTLTDDTDVRYMYLELDADGDGTYETVITRDFVLEAGVKNAGVSADQTSITYTYADAVVNYKGYVLDGYNNKTEFATPVVAATIDGTEYYSFEEAVSAAKGMESATIELQVDVTLDEVVTIEADDNITITDNGTQRTIYRGSELTGKLFDVAGALNVVGTAKDMLVINGNEVAATGNAIAVGTGAALTVDNALIDGLHSGTYAAAALYFNTGSAVSMTNTTVSNTVGAVLYAQGAPAADTTYSFESCTFSGNSAGAAGAVFNSAKNAKFTITDCTFENNSATGHGGVIYVDQSVYTITGSSFTGNKTTGGHGGAITVSASANSKVYITDSTFDGNSAAGHGGTIYARNGACTVEITGGSIQNSTAGRNGGAIMAEVNANVTVTNVTFSNNEATGKNLAGTGYGEDIRVDAGAKLTVNGISASDIHVADATSVAPVVKATEVPVTANMTVAKGYVKVAGQLAEGSALTLTWTTVPEGYAVVFDSAAMAQTNKASVLLSDAMSEQTLYYNDHSNVAAFSAQAILGVEEWNVTLGDDIGVNLYMNIADPDNTQVSITVNGETATVNASELTAENGQYLISVDMAAAQMMDAITVKLTCGEMVFENTYTVRQYADTILNGDYDDVTQTLVKEMLNYGAAAQVYFGYNTDNLANAGIEGAGAAAVPETAETEMSVTGSAEGISYYGATLVFGSKTAVRFYFTGDVTGCTFKVGETEYTPVLKNGRYYVEIADINPQELDQAITLSVNGTLTVTYAPMNYMVRMSVNGSDNLQALLQALYNYHLAAVEYAK